MSPPSPPLALLRRCVSDVTHHPELGLGLLHQIVLFGLVDAGEDARLRVEVQHVALEIRQEVAKTANATHSHDTLGEEREAKRFCAVFEDKRSRVTTLRL